MQEKEAGPVEGDGAALSGEGEGEEEEEEAAEEEAGNEGDDAGTRATSATTTDVLTPSLPGGGAAGRERGDAGAGSAGDLGTVFLFWEGIIHFAD